MTYKTKHLIAGVVMAISVVASGQESDIAPHQTPSVRLATVSEDDAGNKTPRPIEERVSWLVERTAKASTIKDKVELSLASANLILARVIEPYCSLAMLTLDSESLRKPLEASMAQAAERLAFAQDLLDNFTATDEDGEWREMVDRQVRVLRSFHVGLRAYFLPDPDERTARRAISGLSPLLEDGDPSVAAAATFWQACLRSLDQDTSRAISVLDPPLSDVREGDLPYAFFARVLRCRLLSRQGGHVAALALLMQMEDRCEDWFPDDVPRGDAIRTLQLARYQILTAWEEQLPENTRAAERTWIAERKKQLVESSFPEDRNTLLRLLPVIPIIAPPPPDSAEGSTTEP